MLGKLLPLVFALVGLGGGVGAGLALRPEPAPVVAADASSADECVTADATPGDAAAAGHASEDGSGDHDTATEFVKMNNQFVVPVVKEDNIAALVVMSISLEVPVGSTEKVYQREPKLRDAFLQVLFDHANSGGFDGAFTAGPNMQALRTALGEVAHGELGANVSDVLITDIARQDI